MNQLSLFALLQAKEPRTVQGSSFGLRGEHESKENEETGSPFRAKTDLSSVDVLPEPPSKQKPCEQASPTNSGEARESTKAITPPPMSHGRNEALDSRGAAQSLSGGDRQATEARASGFDSHRPHDITANYHRGNPQSVEAGQKAHKGAEIARKRILEALRRSNGLSCDQLEELTGLSHQSCSARISELKREGKIVKAGTRQTRSGCNAAVYKVRA